DIAELLVVGAALVIRHRVPVERGGDQLIRCRVWQHIARKLLDREAIEWHVRIEAVDDVIAVLPDCARRIVGVTGAVGISCEVEPESRPVLSEHWLRQQSVDELFVGLWRSVLDERFHFLWRWRQTCEIQSNTTHKRVLVCFGLWRKPFLLETG